MFRRANRLRAKLGGPPGAAHEVAAKPKPKPKPKPKHMRWRTYLRMLDDIHDLETAGFSTFAALLRRMSASRIVRVRGLRQTPSFWGGRP